MWQGVLHHVCGEHEWAQGHCEHEALDDEEDNSSRKYLSKDSKALAALRKIVLDPKWLKTLHFYVRFRYQGNSKPSTVCLFFVSYFVLLHTVFPSLYFFISNIVHVTILTGFVVFKHPT